MRSDITTQLATALAACVQAEAGPPTSADCDTIRAAIAALNAKATGGGG